MHIFSDYERGILERFKKGKYIETEEENTILDEFSSIGFISHGYDFDVMKGTAKLTDLCLRHLYI